MNSTQLSLFSLSVDLSRIAMSIAKKNTAISRRFQMEAVIWIDELREAILPEYISAVIEHASSLFLTPDTYEKADDFVTYSTIISNYAKRME